MRDRRVLLIPIIVGVLIILALGWLLTKDTKKPVDGTGTASNSTTNTNGTPSGSSGNNSAGSPGSTTGGVAVTPTDTVTKANDIQYSGTDALLDRGVTTAQINDLKVGFLNFFKSKGMTISRVTITDPQHIHDADSSTDSMYMTVQADNNSYKARMDYYELTKARLYIFNTSNEQIFDSQPINS